MSLKSLKFLFLAVIVPLVFCAVQYSHAQTTDSALIEATSEIVQIGADLTKTSIQNGDVQSAEQYSKFTTDYYANQVNELREEKVDSADDLHLLLIDIHSKISNSQTSTIVSDLDSDRKSTRLNSSHVSESRMPSSA